MNDKNNEQNTIVKIKILVVFKDFINSMSDLELHRIVVGRNSNLTMYVSFMCGLSEYKNKKT